MLPFQVYGNWLLHIVMVSVLVIIELTFKVNVTTESQPPALINVSAYVPVALYWLPFQVYGNWLLQMVTVTALVSIEFTFKVSVTIESQPLELVNVSL